MSDRIGQSIGESADDARTHAHELEQQMDKEWQQAVDGQPGDPQNIHDETQRLHDQNEHFDEMKEGIDREKDLATAMENPGVGQDIGQKLDE